MERLAKCRVHCPVIAAIAIACCWIALGVSFAFAADTSGVGLLRDVVFNDMTPLSRNAELERRMWPPVMAAQLQRDLAHSGKVLSEQSIKLSDEKFVVYVPPAIPPNGYALLVFIPPWKDAHLPPGWASVLDRYGVIFVSAAQSGNNVSDFGRRMPLALNAAYNIIQRYAVNPQRTYIAGFSGGSRVAMRLALAYPDLFRGALLNAGSDPVGNEHVPLPSKDLLLQFQTSTHLVYLTGKEDAVNLDKDEGSMHAMRTWCEFNLDTEVMLNTGHAVADANSLSRALKLLLEPAQPDLERLNACRSEIEKDLETQLQQVDALKKTGKRDEARALLSKIDVRFGGLASPRSLEMDAEFESQKK